MYKYLSKILLSVLLGLRHRDGITGSDDNYMFNFLSECLNVSPHSLNFCVYLKEKPIATLKEKSTHTLRFRKILLSF